MSKRTLGPISGPEAEGTLFSLQLSPPRAHYNPGLPRQPSG